MADNHRYATAMRLVEWILVRSANSPAADERFQRSERCVVKEGREECFRGDWSSREDDAPFVLATNVHPTDRCAAPHRTTPRRIIPAPHLAASRRVGPGSRQFAHVVWTACVMSDRLTYRRVSEKKLKWSWITSSDMIQTNIFKMHNTRYFGFQFFYRKNVRISIDFN